jgi:hypothetical protein
MWGALPKTQYQTWKKGEKYPKTGLILQKRVDYGGFCDEGLGLFGQG